MGNSLQNFKNTIFTNFTYIYLKEIKLTEELIVKFINRKKDRWT